MLREFRKNCAKIVRLIDRRVKTTKGIWVGNLLMVFIAI